MSARQRSIFSVVLWVGLMGLPQVARADHLGDAEAAYGRVDFSDAERLARAALSDNGHDRAQMIRIYFLLGVSAAAEGKDEASIEAFKHLLALDPETKLDRDLSPKLQGPMLEARGTPPAPLTCEALFNQAMGVLHFTIRDQLRMSSAVVVRWRLSHGGEFTESRRPSAPTVDFAIPGAMGAERVEYSYQLVDGHRNRLVEKGSDAAAEVFQVAAVAPGAAAVTAAPAEHKIATKYLALGIVGEVLGVGGLAGGLAAYLVGQSAANHWNNDSVCLANGLSRSANCASDRSTAQAAGNGAIAGFVIGGAFVVASTVALIVAGRPRERVVGARAALDCGPGPGQVGIACGGRF